MREATRTTKTGPRIDDAGIQRLRACHLLLIRAATDIGIKAEGSSKLTRALEDVAEVRDTLWELTGSLGPTQATIDIPRPSRGCDSTAEHIHAVVFHPLVPLIAAKTNWSFSRGTEAMRRAEEAGDE